METALDLIELFLICAAVLLAVPIILKGNGTRPVAMIILWQLAIWSWAIYDGLWINQTDMSHARRILGPLGILVFVWLLLRKRHKVD